MKVSDERYKFNLGLQYGSIPDNIYFQEPKAIQQANIAVLLADRLWLYGGIMSTHVGGEITHPRSNFLSTHSNLTFYEPTYQTGFKLEYVFTQNLSANIQLINGNHLFADNNEQKTVACNLDYSSDDFNVFYSAMAGNEEPTGKKARLHTYHNLFAAFKISAIEAKVQADMATLENSTDDNKTGMFYGAFAQVRYPLLSNLYASARYSYFYDNDKVYKTDVEGYDLTAGIEFKPHEKSYLRLESRYMQFNSGEKSHSFGNENNRSNSRLEFMINFGLWFDHTFKL